MPRFVQRWSSPGDIWHVPLTQLWPIGQLPQWRRPPQPSLAAPQVLPSAWQVVLLQVSQTWLTASQTWLAGQVPHMSGLPQPSLAAPHWKPSAAQSFGAQVPQE
jgi:hypothetical protein